MHIIDECITQNTFPTACKKSRKSPVPKVDNPKECDDYRPIAILSVFSKVYECCVLKQMTELIEEHNIRIEKISGYRKGHSTTSILMRFRDDIIQAMKKGELTMVIYADFLKAFDTVDHLEILENCIKWSSLTTSYNGFWVMLMIDDS